MPEFIPEQDTQKKTTNPKKKKTATASKTPKKGSKSPSNMAKKSTRSPASAPAKSQKQKQEKQKNINRLNEFSEAENSKEHLTDVLPETPEDSVYYPLPEYDPALSYAGFQRRMLATVIDMFCVLVVALPFSFLIQSLMQSPIPDGLTVQEIQTIVLRRFILNNLFQFGLFAAFSYLCWVKLSGTTPGKFLLAVRIVNATDGSPPTSQRCIRRLIGYVISALPVGLGFFAMVFNRRKQGWHDKIAGTVCIVDFTHFRRFWQHCLNFLRLIWAQFRR